MNSGRRDFFKAVGTVAAAAAAASPVLKPTQSAAAERGYAAGASFLALDGTPVGYLRSFEGGEISAVVETEPVDENGVVPKYVAGINVEDILIGCGNGMAPSFYQWIQQFLNRNPELRSGAIVDTDARQKPVSQLSFLNARISEVVFPEVNASSKTPATISVRLTPEFTKDEAPSNAAPSLGNKTKQWIASNFRVRIGGISESATSRVNKVEAITIKQEAAPEISYAQRASTIDVEPLDVGPIVLTVSEQFAKPFFDWHRQFVVQGDGAEETFLTLEYLDPNMKVVLFTLHFSGVGVVRVGRMRGDAKGEALRRVRVEMYAEQVSLTVGALGTA